MPPLYVIEQGAKIRITGRRLVVSKDEREIAVVPLVKVSEVVLLGNISLTTPAIQALLEEGIDVRRPLTPGRAL